jgi:parallel beta-helix repeat protein
MAVTNGIVVICWSVLASTSVFATSGPLVIATDTKLHEDHFGPITFVADSVTLNCAGHQVSATGEFQAILIQDRAGVTVKNCNITGAVFGVRVIRSTDAVIKNNIAFGNEGTGMFFSSSNDLTIKNNVATRNGVAGMDIQFVTNSTVQHNTASNNSFFGFLILVANNNEFKGNIAAGNTAFGFILFSSSGNLLQKNSACGHRADLLLDTILPGANELKNDNFCVVEEQISGAIREKE